MKIVLDLRIYGPAYGGLGRYNQKLLENLIELDQDNQYIILVKEKLNIKLPVNFKVKVCNCHWYGLKEQIVLPLVLKKLKPDLVHFPHFNVPIFYRGKFIVTIHDLIMTRFPSRRASTLNRFLFYFKYWLYRRVINYAIKKAVKIIAVSKFTAQDIKEYFKLNDHQFQKIAVVYEGLTIPQDIKREDVGLPSKFLLYVGNAYPHKNLEFLITAFKEFLNKHSGYYLIIVGPKSYFYNQLREFKNKIMIHQKDRVIMPGFVPDDQLVDYYQAATVYVFPSLYEGFGLPPLEAMSYNLPVVSSYASSLPEILGQAALFFDPTNQSDFLEKLEQIIDNQELREKLKIKGQEQIKEYSWDKMAKEILEIYNNV